MQTLNPTAEYVRGGACAMRSNNFSKAIETFKFNDCLVKVAQTSAVVACESLKLTGQIERANTAGEVAKVTKNVRNVTGLLNVVRGALVNNITDWTKIIPSQAKALADQGAGIEIGGASIVLVSGEISDGGKKLSQKMNPYAFALTTGQKIAAFVSKIFDAIALSLYNYAFGVLRVISFVANFTAVDPKSKEIASKFPFIMAIQHLFSIASMAILTGLDIVIYKNLDHKNLTLAEHSQILRNGGGRSMQRGLKIAEKVFEIGADAGTVYKVPMPPIVIAVLNLGAALFGITGEWTKAWKPDLTQPAATS